MKILLITDNHNENGGGAEKSFFTLKRALQTNTNLAVFSLGFGAEKTNGIDFTVLKKPSSNLGILFWRIFFNPIKYFEIRRVIKKFNPDVIHLHNVRQYTITLFQAIKGFKVVQTTHDFTSICPTGWNVHNDLQPCAKGITRQCFWNHQRSVNTLIYIALSISFARLRRLLKKSVNVFITPSTFLQKYLEAQQFTPAVTIPPFLSNKQNLQFDKMQPNHFLYVGQLGMHKGVDLLIDEFILALAENPNLKLNILGNGSEELKLRIKVKRHNLDNSIIFHGWQNPEKFYSETSALIFPSVGLEAFGLVITEAMAHGRAVIGSNRGPTQDLINDNVTGLLYDPLKKGNLAAKILAFCSQDMARKLGKNAYEQSQSFPTHTEIVQKTLDIYSLASVIPDKAEGVVIPAKAGIQSEEHSA